MARLLPLLLHAEAFVTHTRAPCFEQLTSADDHIARACTGLQLLHSACGRFPFWHKVGAHQGHLLNEIADAAKSDVFRSAQAYAPDKLSCFWQAVDERIFEWLWLTRQPHSAALPFLTPLGAWTEPEVASQGGPEAMPPRLCAR